MFGDPNNSQLKQMAALPARMVGAAGQVSPNAARSTTIHLHNRTSKTLVLNEASVYRGEWHEYRDPDSDDPDDKLEASPAIEVGPGASTFWASESAGVMTGTAGCVWYNVKNAGLGERDWVKIYWNNPYSGSNDWNFEQPTGFRVVHDSGGKGDNAKMSWSVLEDQQAADDSDSD